MVVIVAVYKNGKKVGTERYDLVNVLSVHFLFTILRGFFSNTKMLEKN